MKYEVDFPDHIAAKLNQRAAAAGGDVVHLIQVAVVQFVEQDVTAASSRRLLDPPLPVVEVSPPFDLPRHEPTPISLDTDIDESARLPDSPTAEA
ncbi:MAG: hypothetical protein CMJ64_02725 [Planctomycetaceae bacterium]|nr:hypothetical protein [Planctomycetaceae bacterium]